MMRIAKALLVAEAIKLSHTAAPIVAVATRYSCPHGDHGLLSDQRALRETSSRCMARAVGPLLDSMAGILCSCADNF